MKNRARKILAKLLPHAALFYDDMQNKTSTTNYHGRMDTFLKSLESGVKILDIGSGNRKISLNNKTVVSFDKQKHTIVDIIGDAGNLPFEDKTFDAIILQQVLEHIMDPLQVLKEANRVLKEDGKIYIEVPFMYPIHDEYDYWRWTLKGLDIMCSKLFDRSDVGSVMGPGNALSLISRTSLSTLFSFGNRKLFNILDVFFGLFTFWFKYVDLVIKDNANTGNVAPAIYFIGKRKNRC